MKDIRDFQLINEGAEIATLTKEHYNYKLQNRLIILMGSILLIGGLVYYYYDIQRNEL